MTATSARARGRPREFCSEKALAAALTVFLHRGYEGASLAELTSEMGITKPSLYACFGNKEGLFRKAIDLYERDKLAYMGFALEAPTARGVAERMLRGAMASYWNDDGSQGCLGVISAAACGAEAEPLRNEMIARCTLSDTALVKRLLRARTEGNLPEAIEPEALACYLTTVMQGMSVRAAAGTSRAALQRVIETTLVVWPGE